MNTQKFAAVVLDIGERMIYCGAEIYRVEDTLIRICRAYKAVRVDVFAIPSAIIMTLQMENDLPCTQIKRLRTVNATDLEYLNSLNDFSRSICKNPPEVEQLEEKLNAIPRRVYSKYVKCFINAVISASFSLYVGGSLKDAALSAGIGVLLAIATMFFGRINITPNFASFCSAFYCGLIAAVLCKLGIGTSVDNIIIGNIMILVPGLAITNAIRDMINGDIVSGLILLSKSLFTAVALAAGFALALVVFGL